MNRSRLIATVSAIALGVAPAQADVTPAEVWSDWQSVTEMQGGVVTTESLDDSGGDLVARGTRLAYALEGGEIVVTLGDIAFRSRGDGTVEVELTEDIEVSMASTVEGDEGSASFVLGHEDLDIVVSGDAESITYDFEAASLTMGDLAIDAPADEEMEDFELTLEVTLRDVDGRTTLSGDEAREIESAVQSAGLTVAASGAGTDPETGEKGNFRLALDMTDLEQTITGRIIEVEPETGLGAMIEAGMRYAVGMGYGSSDYRLSGEAEDGPFDISGSARDGRLDASVGEAGLDYATSTGAQTFTLTGGQVPLPVNVRIAGTGARLKAPLIPSENRQDIALSFRLEGLEPDETIWNLIDPSEQFPREPATVVLDLSGEVVLNQDFTDPEVAIGDTPPGTLESVTLNELRIEAGGASATGEGAFTFDNSGEVPQPSGQIELTVAGANATIDRLIAMGMLPEQQAMGARMMLGLFARPGPGDDELLSTIEVREDGSVYANGQRIR